jgi:O-Antigen ligase
MTTRANAGVIGRKIRSNAGPNQTTLQQEQITEVTLQEFDPVRTEFTEAYPLWAVLFLVALCIPLSFLFGTFRMSPYRVILLITFIPAVVTLVSGRAGKVTSIDFFFFAATAWAALSLFVNTNFGDVYQTAAIFFFETFGSYLIARVYVSSFQQFYKFVKVLLVVFLILLPFAMIETFGHKNLALLVLGSIGTSYKIIDIGARMGLYRAQVTFEHPILWGVFASSMFGILTYTMGQGKSVLSSILGVLTSLATISSMSSGALVSLATQLIVVAWDVFTKTIKNRWRLLGGIMTALYIIVDLISTRSPFQVFITYLTFSAQSSYNRVNIWTFGTAEVWRHPFFGIGLGDWIRPRYMSASMDNFWLATTVRYGLPTFIFFTLGIVGLMRRMGKANLTEGPMINARTGLMATYVGIILSGCTTHYWNEMYCWVMFLFGLGHWCLNYQPLAKSDQLEIATSQENNKTQAHGFSKRHKSQSTLKAAAIPKQPQDTIKPSEKKWLK